MSRVLATGTFDLLHPGHVHYLESSASLGDELWVIVARSSMIEHKAPPILPDEQRREMVAAMDAVDEAVLGSEESIYRPLHEIDPDVLTLGHDQHYSVPTLEEELRSRGIELSVTRIDERRPQVENAVYSTSDILSRARRARRRSTTIGTDPTASTAAPHTRTGVDVPDDPDAQYDTSITSILF